ncbi:MAG TPA: vitamin K epoxide reductase family protein [Thermoanaerobaculia bacterium]|nr:vitamin K epoxide reductase family protein [Thermoanaerobaculia bacterium]
MNDDIRTVDTPELARRRGIVALSLTASAAMGVIALYQTGIIKHLPEPPLRSFDADRIDASAEAYKRFSTPDSLLGLGSYAMTAGLAAMGGRDRARLISLAMAAKVAFDAANAMRLTVVQWKDFRAWCFWCLIAAGATFAMVPLVIPEAIEAITPAAK